MEDQLQINKLLNELEKLNPNVTKEDRETAMQVLKIKSKTTISIYLNGKGTDADTAVKLIKFFRARIQKRNQVLA